MADSTILNLGTANALDGSEWVWLIQGGADKRATTADIANTATGFVPNSRAVNAGTGLSGGGVLSGDITLNFNPVGLSAASTMAVTDSFVINNSVTPKIVTFPLALQAIGGLSASPALNLAADKFAVLRAADGLVYSATASQISIAAGNVPAGGTTGQFLAKVSNTDYDTEWADPSILLDALSIAANPTGSQDFAVSVTLGATLAFSGTALQTGAGTGDVTWSANAFSTTIAANAVTDAKFRQSAALSVVGRSANSSGNVADIAAGADYNILRRSGTSIGFGAIDLSQSGAVGSSILAGANGGTGVANTGKTITLGGNLTTSGAFSATFTLTGDTNVTFPTSGTLATTGGASIPSIAQGDLLYGSASNVLSALAKDTNATRYLSNTGSSNNPAWAQIALATGVSGQLPLTNGGTNASLTADNGGIVYSGASALAILASTATAGQIIRSGSSAAPSWSTATFPATTAAGTILASGSANTVAGTATPTLGIAGSVVGTLSFANATSGSITLSPVAGALGTATLTMPAATDTIAVLAASQAFTNKTYNGLTITSSTGTLTVTNGKTLSISNSLTFTGTDSTSFTFPSSSSTVLTVGNTATITVGYTVTPANGGTVSSGTFTVTPATQNYQYYTNNGAHTFAAPASDCAVDVLVTNGASAGAITFSGFTVGSSTGSSLNTTNTNKFLISVRRINSISTYSIYALQ